MSVSAETCCHGSIALKKESTPNKNIVL